MAKKKAAKKKKKSSAMDSVREIAQTIFPAQESAKPAEQSAALP